VKVLIIDDSPEAVALVKVRLSKDGLDVICADGGTAGMEAVKHELPDLILLDVDMPDISGFDVCRMLKADPELCVIPIVFLSASDSAEDKVRGLPQLHQQNATENQWRRNMGNGQLRCRRCGGQDQRRGADEGGLQSPAPGKGSRRQPCRDRTVRRLRTGRRAAALARSTQLHRPDCPGENFQGLFVTSS
jgi:CheY-like chemotaxis protein